MAQVSADLVAKADIFQGLQQADLEALAGLASFVTVGQGEVLVEESAKGEDLYVILHGRIDIHVKMPDGNESESIALLKEGESLGESILLGRTRRIASAIAKDNVQALKWNVGDLDGYFATNPSVGYTVMRNLAKIVHDRLTATNMLLRNTINRAIDIL